MIEQLEMAKNSDYLSIRGYPICLKLATKIVLLK